MSMMLASVNSLEEARLVLRLNADIIDLKQPAQGALGALETKTVAEIVANLKPLARLSATVGDLPMNRDLLSRAVLEMAATGIDYVKIGFFPGGDWQDSIAGLASIARQGNALIAVLFADTKPDFALIEILAQAGFRGVMLDTMEKRQGSLTRLMTLAELQNFVRTAKKHALITGLAGSLAVEDIAGLLSLNADYLGFRGALCKEGRRTAQLDELQITRIRHLLAEEDMQEFGVREA